MVAFHHAGQLVTVFSDIALLVPLLKQLEVFNDFQAGIQSGLLGSAICYSTYLKGEGLGTYLVHA